MARKTEWYEELAARAPWRGTVNGKPAYIERFKRQWEVCCRVTKDGKGVIMFTLTNKEAIRRLTDAVEPPIPEDLRKKLMKGARRDVPVKAPGPPAAKVAAVVVLVLAAAAAATALLFPRALEVVRSALSR